MYKPINNKIITNLGILGQTINLPNYFLRWITLRKSFLHGSLLMNMSIWIQEKEVLAKLFMSIFKLSQSFKERYKVKVNKIVYTNKNILAKTLKNMVQNLVFDKPSEWVSFKNCYSNKSFSRWY